MRVQKAWRLKNNLGEIMDISSRDFFFTDVSGMGLSLENKYQKIGNRFINISSEKNLQKLKGKLYIKGEDSAVDNYKKFIDFCSSTPLIVLFAPTIDAEEYAAQALIGSVEKNRNVSAIVCDIEFELLSNFYKDAYSSFSDQGAQKVYAYQYPVKYNDLETGTAFIDVDSNSPNGTMIEIYGPCTNPEWKYYCNGKYLGNGKVNISVEENNKLVIDTISMPYQIKILTLDGKVVSNAYPFSNFNTKRFFLTEKGRNRVTVSADSKSDIVVTLKARVEYAAV